MCNKAGFRVLQRTVWLLLPPEYILDYVGTLNEQQIGRTIGCQREADEQHVLAEVSGVNGKKKEPSQKTNRKLCSVFGDSRPMYECEWNDMGQIGL